MSNSKKLELISSVNNPKFKLWKSLLQSKGIKEHNKYLVFGKSVVEDLLQKKQQTVEAILLPESFDASMYPFTKNFLLTNEIFQQLDVFGTKFPIAVLTTPSLLPFSFSQSKGIVVFSPLGDPSNLGATLRSCNAFGITQIVLLKESANPFHPKSVRAASGNLFDLEFFSGPSIHELQEYAPKIYALDRNGKNISETQTTSSLWLLVGEEGPGLPDLPFQKLSIPISANCESLNASVAIGIALYELTKKQR